MKEGKKREVKKSPAGKEYPIELVMHDSMLLAIVDMLDAEIVDFAQICRKHGYSIKEEQMRHFKAIKHHGERFRALTRGIKADEQVAVGNTSELFLMLLWQIAKRCDADPEKYFKLYNLIKSSFKDAIPEVNIDRLEKDAVDTMMELMSRKEEI